MRSASSSNRLQRWWRRLSRRHTLSSTARTVRQERLTYLSEEKLGHLEETAACVVRQGVRGDILEFGVALGGSAIVLADLARRDGRSFHGFDVFEMIPPPTSEKDDEKSKQRYEIIASGKSKGINGDVYYGYRENLYEEVLGSFARHGIAVDGQAVALHKGLFQDTWPRCGVQAVAFVHIDCDWYDPVKFCLESVSSRLSPGGVIVLDDFHAYGGCRVATTEFLSAHSEYIFEDAASPVLRRIADEANATTPDRVVR